MKMYLYVYQKWIFFSRSLILLVMLLCEQFKHYTVKFKPKYVAFGYSAASLSVIIEVHLFWYTLRHCDNVDEVKAKLSI